MAVSMDGQVESGVYAMPLSAHATYTNTYIPDFVRQQVDPSHLQKLTVRSLTIPTLKAV